MSDKQIDKIEKETGCHGISFDDCEGLTVFVDPDNKTGLAIAGMPCIVKGMAVLNREQVFTLARDLQGIAELYLTDCV